MTFKSRVKRTFLGLLGLFISMFLFRLIFGFVTVPSVQHNNYFPNAFAEAGRAVKNIASNSYLAKKQGAAAKPRVYVDQKFEKIANVQCKSTDFEKDEKALRKSIEAQKAIIQFQQQSGNKGKRKLEMQIGVPPEGFDDFIEILQKDQNVVSLDITKTDKTNEYRALNAKRETLQKTRNSLAELKAKGGKIEEYIQLENRILEIDEKLQNLGVQLGNFDKENEFCTVNVALKEGKVAKISLLQRVKVALEWTIEYYLMLVVALAFVTLQESTKSP